MTVKTIKYCIVVLAVMLYASCSGDEDPVEDIDRIEDCQVDEFYARMLINGKCWTTTSSFFRNNDSSVSIRFNGRGNVAENFLLSLSELSLRMSELNNISKDELTLFIVEGGDGLVTYFEPRYATEKGLNRVEIESINSDTTVISGKFEAVLYRNMPEGNQEIYPSPERLEITDGQFRVQRRE